MSCVVVPASRRHFCPAGRSEKSPARRLRYAKSEKLNTEEHGENRRRQAQFCDLRRNITIWEAAVAACVAAARVVHGKGEAL